MVTHYYPASYEIQLPAQYNRWSVAFRIILVIPHIVALVFLGIAQAIVTLIAWMARVEEYFYLFVDEYPPFTVGMEAGGHAPLAQPI